MASGNPLPGWGNLLEIIKRQSVGIEGELTIIQIGEILILTGF
jgi:hypothetical protein